MAEAAGLGLWGGNYVDPQVGGRGSACVSSRLYRTPVLIQVKLRCIRECIHAAALLIYAFVPFASIRSRLSSAADAADALLAWPSSSAFATPLAGPLKLLFGAVTSG